MNRLFRDLTMNIVLKMVVGKRHFGVHGENNEEVKRIQSVIVDIFKFTGVSVASDVLPSFLSWLDLDGQQRAMKKTAKEMDMLAESWLQEHQQKRVSGKTTDGNQQQDFMDVMLSFLEDDAQLHGHERDTIVKATNMILAATDTSAISLSWVLSLLLNQKEVLKKAKEELDFHIGKDRNVEEEDIDNLVYLQAIIKETLHLYPAGPLLVPHEAMEDCILSSGFRVIKGTRVLVNAWKIHRDPRVWTNPLEFQPERFLTRHADVDVRGQSFELIPFGSGRRSCPGLMFALQTRNMTVTCLLHGFNLQTPFDQPVDMTEDTGLTMPKEFPLEVLLSPRLSYCHLFE
ncbi:xanthotoxin 5-hydroxylase CYP82C4-like [Macadamia integrifolia]|uniref:xanthotoxin 5-hydroxylase CYP82C4-like n=1 Tax=Macadamia integrifolia TaxID=60698 RepID=UPI001C500B89|nr:xanthotoxin 5-hydroxylase CYP82C4-like [Macadamia integrifolia]